jgi:HPt (histidine-containing phosphotransfer) domain-containing protein
MSATGEPEFDWSQTASLLGEDPLQVPDDMVEIVQELIENANQQLQELKKKNVETERKAIGAQAHQLRGSLLNFGFIEVGRILYQIEKGEHPVGEYSTLISQAENSFVASKKLLGERYPSLKLG